MPVKSLPVAIIGAGPVGLAAAAHLLERGETPLVLEAGPAVGSSIRQWGHVRFFSPWRYAVDSASARLLEATGWARPDPDTFPTGNELVERYLVPLATTPQLQPHLRFDARVTAVTRQGLDKLKTAGRDEAPFALYVTDAAGNEDVVLARAAIDASGTWVTPNPIGSSGVPAPGERAAAAHIRYGIPDVLGAERARYAGRRVLVLGSGHSAFNVILDLATLLAQEGRGQITWAVRRRTIGQLFGGGENDALEERGKLGQRVQALVARGALQLVTGFQATRLRQDATGVTVIGEDATLSPVDEIVAATGFRPDLTLLRELRLDLDPATESSVVLAPLIDPNVHSCGTVRPHGAAELRHAEADFYIAGMKSYGRAPTFLLLTGYEQVRSIASALVGDWESARRVELVLPETGVCSTNFDDGATASSCSAPEPPRGLRVLPVAVSAASGYCTPPPVLAVAGTRESKSSGRCCG